jgi:RimJ/RimL family protein N-acetyltransferase
VTVVIETARLLLRQPAIEDFDDLHALTASPEMREHLPGFATVEDSYKRLLSNLGGWATFGFGTFSLRERETGDYVGNCGLFRMMRGLGEDFDADPEAGWIVASSRWGRGYAVEAMTAALDWFERVHCIRKTNCMIAPANRSSNRIADKLGYHPTRKAKHGGEAVQLFTRIA